MAVYFQLDGQQIASALEAIGWQSSGGGSANVTYDSVVPTAPFNGQLWFDTTVEKLKMYNGGVWIELSLTQAEVQSLTASIAAVAEIQGMSATATTLPAGSNATASYSNGVLTLGLPKGDSSVGASIDDTITADTATWSSTKINDAINANTGIIDASWLTPTPTISITTTVEENQPVVATISNYDAGVTYTITATSGTITNINSNTFTYTAPDITNGVDTTDTITISGYKAGLIRSLEQTTTMTILYVPMVADDVLSNVNFSSNENYNDGMVYL